MLETLPNWMYWVFLMTVLSAVVLFYLGKRSKRLILFILLWSLGHSILAYTGFYQNTEAFPPRFLGVILPIIGGILFGLTKKNRDYILHKRRTDISTFLHTVRVPVEVMLFCLYSYDRIPKLMTFEGRNYDILAGAFCPGNRIFMV